MSQARLAVTAWPRCASPWRLEREDADPLRLERAILPPTREGAALLRSVRWALESARTSDDRGLRGGGREASRARRQIGLFAGTARAGRRPSRARATARASRPGRVLRARVAMPTRGYPSAPRWKEVIS